MTSPTPTEPGVSVELFVRSVAPGPDRPRLERTVGRLDGLTETGAVQDVRVQVTGPAVPATPAAIVTAHGAFLHERIAAFRAWADETGRTLRGFEHRSTTSSLTDECYDCIVLPSLALAEYVDGTLRFVAPSAADGHETGVEERVAALATEPIEEPEQPRPASPAIEQ